MDGQVNPASMAILFNRTIIYHYIKIITRKTRQCKLAFSNFQANCARKLIPVINISKNS